MVVLQPYARVDFKLKVLQAYTRADFKLQVLQVFKNPAVCVQ